MAKEAKPPTKLAEVFKDKDLTKQFEDYCKKEYVTENLDFYMIRSWSAQNVYKIYFAKGAKSELNLSDDILGKAREMGTKKDWDNKEWKGLMKDAKEKVYDLMEKDTFRRFLKTLKTAGK